jgi:hypothetical protein
MNDNTKNKFLKKLKFLLDFFIAFGQLVFELYGLTAKEVKLIKNKL